MDLLLGAKCGELRKIKSGLPFLMKTPFPLLCLLWRIFGGICMSVGTADAEITTVVTHRLNQPSRGK